MDWTATGIENNFEFELIDPFNLEVSRGFLQGVTGGTITEELGSDYFSSMQLDIDGEALDGISLIRVWHVATLGDETVREELGTFMQDGGEADRSMGRSTGSVDLYSTMLRLGTDLRKGDWGIAAGRDAVGFFETIVENSGGTPLVQDRTVTGSFPAAHVWECGESVLDECQRCADACGGRVGVDTHGRVTMSPAENPALIQPSFSIETGDASLVMPGISISQPEIVNRVVASYERDDIRYFSAAEVPVDHPWHWTRIGRWATEELTVDEIEDGDDPQPILDDAVRARLAEVAYAGVEIGVDMLYRPMAVGHVGTFTYADSPDDPGIGPLRVQLIQREITLDKTMKVTATFREVG